MGRSLTRLTFLAGLASLQAALACSTPPGEASSAASKGASPASSPPPAPAPPAQAPPAAPDAAAQAQASEPRWFPWYDWSLEVDGRPSTEAMFFRERNGRRLIIRVPGLPKTVLLNTAGQHVYALENDLVSVPDDGSQADLAPDAERNVPGSTYTSAGHEVIFFIGDRRLKITPKEPLEGQVTLEQILAHTPLYRKGIEEYSPEAAEISYLRSVREAADIEVYFGTWCPHCKIIVPRFMKAMNLAANPALRVRYIGVPKEFGNYGPARAKSVRGIPTFVFVRDGKEFGRIPGEPTSGSIEHAVAEILKAGAS